MRPATVPVAPDEVTDKALSICLPAFHAVARDFPDLRLARGLSAEQIASLEQALDYSLDNDLKKLLGQLGAIAMNGLSLRADQFGPIVMPDSEALVIGEFYLHNPGDRLLMLAGEATIYYLEQRNGAITKMAANIHDFFDKTILHYL